MVSLAFPQSALNNWLRPERSGQLARLVNILLVVWLAWMLAGLSWLLFPEPESLPEAQPGVGRPAPVQRQQPRIDEQQIAGWHIFGVAGEEKPVAQPATVDAPDTSLKLTLRGVFASDDPAEARAIVGDPRGKEEHYSVGDPLPGNATLTEIHPDRIILERNGRYETLRLPRDLTPAAGGNTAARSRPRSAGAGNTAAKAAAFTRYRNEIKQNPSTFLNYVRATPARQGGKFIGFRLQAGRERGALKELGLRPGDIVTSINGVQIDSPAKGMKAMQALGEGDNVSVTLLRGGRETSLSLVLPSGSQ
jgi:general secretion pathway protein C